MESTNKPPFRLLVGLGNPGREYSGTRHNVGFMIVEKLAARAGVAFRYESKWDAEVAPGAGCLLCKPMSYMNVSGQPVAAVSHFYKIAAAGILVVLDDAALPLGRLRLRSGGSSGGHNGMQSIISQLGTPEVARLRIGIGAASERPMVDHVLGRFTREEQGAIEASLDRAVEAIDCAQSEGLEAAMNRFN